MTVALSFFVSTPSCSEAARKAVTVVSVADVRASSGTLPTALVYDPLEETQLLFGEPVEILAESGEWLRIEAPEQQEFSHAQLWQGYPGWIRKESVMETDRPPAPNTVVRIKKARLRNSPEYVSLYRMLPVGAQLELSGAKSGEFLAVRSPDSGTGWVLPYEINSLAVAIDEKKAREEILRTAREFLGTPYFWGGRSQPVPELKPQVLGVDCSGLVNLAYRVAGIHIPRDSLEQWLRARKISRGELKPGDLIFAAPKGKPERIVHVAVYAGKGKLIEAPQSGMFVREISFEKKFGIPFEEAENGKEAEERILYFGTYFPSGGQTSHEERKNR